MREIKGEYNTAKVFTDVIEKSAEEQIELLCNQPFVKNSKIRVMPDCHAGAGCVIGFTMSITDYVCPNLVGVDIGCGMLTVKLGNIGVDFGKLDAVIRKYVPSGFSVHENSINAYMGIRDLKCLQYLQNFDRLNKSTGTLGGGNHFIEIDTDKDGNKYLVIHSGSRNLGNQVAAYYQKLAISDCNTNTAELKEIIDRLKREGRDKEIATAIKDIKKPKTIDALCYLTGENMQLYLHDMKICQEFASENRRSIANAIIGEMEWNPFYEFETVHNYIDFADKILRKGAISAKIGELLLIPINMRDGCILGTGKSNEDWNYSAPHGAGRIMSRKQAKESIAIEDYQNTMQGVYSTTVDVTTLDEAPMAYKNIEDILCNIGDTVDVIDVIKPIYNFKASEA